jgi:methyl-accepting chemotaxis protein
MEKELEDPMHTSVRYGLAVRIAVQVSLVILLLSGGYIWLQVSSAEDTAIEVFTNQGTLIGESYLATNAIDIGRLEQFLDHPSEDEAYWAMRAELDRFRKEIGALYVYIFRIDEDLRSYIMIDGQPQDSDVASPINEETDVEAEHVGRLLAGQSTNTSIVDDPLYGVYASSYVPIKGADGSVIAALGIDTEASVLKGVANRIIRSNIPFIIAMILYAIAAIGTIGWLITRSLRPLKTMLAGAERIASGEFREANRVLQERPVRSRNEIGALHRVMAKMSDNLNALIRDMVSGVARTADQLVAASDGLAQEARQLLEGNTKVREAADLVAEGTTSQRGSSEESARSMEETTAAIQRISESALAVADAAGRALESAETGRELIERLNGQIHAVAESAETAAHRAAEMSSRSHEIEEAIGLISQIANQTKVLALNASIEAARAGEQGRGFAVVASHIRQLADESAVTAERMAALLGGIRNDAIRISDEMNAGAEQAKTGEAQSDEVREAFSDILGKFRMVNEHIVEISSAVQQISAGSEEVTATVADIAHIARGSNEQAIHIREQTENQEQIAGRVADAAGELNAAVRQLRDAVRDIRI